MFDKLLRELKKLEQGVTVPVQLHLDEKGYIDRQCPSEECRADFKVLRQDWENKVQAHVSYCPICRFEAARTEWNTDAQREHLREAAIAHLKSTIGQAMQQDAREFNRRQLRGGLISMSMSVKPSQLPVLIPPQAGEALRQEFICDACSCRYSSIGAAFFCPACGHNSAQSTFAAAVRTVRESVLALSSIRSVVEAAADENAAENTVRQLLENGLVKLVASFQRFAEATFHDLPNASTFQVRKNLFQNLNESTSLWRNATGKGFDDFLTQKELSELHRFFQQRHLLAHREGIVDQEYLTKATDTSYSVGQKLVVKDQMVLLLAELVEKLAQALLRTSNPNGSP
ncbi:MAG TPA: hypothetical protein VHC22_19155 [Pirellulales bacterium]|nr:hypothetical protein [Pirellulales bacterium]